MVTFGAETTIPLLKKLPFICITQFKALWLIQKIKIALKSCCLQDRQNFLIINVSLERERDVLFVP